MLILGVVAYAGPPMLVYLPIKCSRTSLTRYSSTILVQKVSKLPSLDHCQTSFYRREFELTLSAPVSETGYESEGECY
jgi:hypothetical protein